MKVILFGATGMIGSGVLLECLADPGVQAVLAVGRKRSGVQHAKLQDLIISDFLDYSGIRDRLTGYNACFFCLGVSSAGMREAEYSHLTYDFTVAAAETLAALNPQMTFCYVSGEGADSTEQGRLMWARVKGRTENALLRLPFKAFMFRPGYIQPLKGVTSRTGLYRAFYSVMAPLFPVVRRLFPTHVTTTENVGRAMIRVAAHGYSRPILENSDINQLATHS
jgi:uncharacterized protein YbjT (DUF2867 family)